MSTLLRIVKVGGSLFNLPDVAARILRWQAAQPRGVTVYLAGLGTLGDAVRNYDQLHQFAPEDAHAMCLETLAVSARMLHSLLHPQAIWTDNLHDFATRNIPVGEQRMYVFSPTSFLMREEPHQPGDLLPAGWDVTTDSISARIAELSHADDLVLLKSKLPEPFTLLDELSAQRYVDNYFPWAARSMAEVRFVNLRDDHFPQVYAFE
jgi:5-(aminomethyl)-3-furanmethanol phosphate kinase